MIYADHAATTPLSPNAYAAMQPWLQDKYGNPSTLYSLAREPRKAVARSRETIAAAINADPNEIFITSGGTEADNWALKGILFKHNRGKGIITSAIEHHAILNSCIALEGMGYTFDTLPVDQEGIVHADTLRSALTSNTALVTIMLANNEIGTIEPITELARIAHQTDHLFHTDAVQAIGHIPVDVKELQVDMLSASAHKFNGPKGTGFLYIRNGIQLVPLLDGGGQECGMRAGIVVRNAGTAIHLVSMIYFRNYRAKIPSFYLFWKTRCPCANKKLRLYKVEELLKLKVAHRVILFITVFNNVFCY